MEMIRFSKDKKHLKNLIVACGVILLLVFTATVCFWLGHKAGTRNPGGEEVLGSEIDSLDREKDPNQGIVDAKAVISKYPTRDGSSPQFVLLAFDGSRSLDMWKQSRTFAREMNASNTPIHFTYFINAVYLLDPQFHKRFASPGESAGISNIGFATSREDVLARIEQINGAYKEGHEIGSHNVGHFEGGTWTFDQWMEQFDLFDDIVFHPEKMRAEYRIDVPRSELVGFRAPDLSINPAMFQALKQKRFLYDASRTAASYDFPYKDENGLWELALPTIYIGSKNGSGQGVVRPGRVLAMDYNLFLHNTKGKDIAKKGTPLWDSIHKQTLDAFMAEFNAQYMTADVSAPSDKKAGKRAPIYFASHFSTWNDGVYWESMKDFARAVCGKPDVYCVTYKDLAMWMEAKETLAKPNL